MFAAIRLDLLDFKSIRIHADAVVEYRMGDFYLTKCGFQLSGEDNVHFKASEYEAYVDELIKKRGIVANGVLL